MDISVLLLVTYQDDITKDIVDSFRAYNGQLEIELILLDHSDNMWSWAQEQTDITYVYFDEEEITYGKMINDVIRELDIQNSILVMADYWKLTVTSLDKMWKLLNQSESYGIVNALVNTKLMLPNNGQSKLESLELWLQENDIEVGEQTISDSEAKALIKHDVIKACGQFDEDSPSLESCLIDYSLRIAQLGYRNINCITAIVWRYSERNEKAMLGTVSEHEFMKKKWGVHYFRVQPNRTVVNIFQEEREREINVLEVGCDCGANLIEIRNRYPNARLYGCELNQEAVNIANTLFPCIQGNIEDYSLPYEDEFFDYIVFADVLEHLRDPLETVRYCKTKLKKNGHIIASIPNLMNITVVEDLLKGNFTYGDFGLLDKTHIHMFTLKEIIRMFEDAGFKSLKYDSVNLDVSDKQRRMIEALINLEPEGDFSMYQTFQYVVDTF